MDRMIRTPVKNVLGSVETFPLKGDDDRPHQSEPKPDLRDEGENPDDVVDGVGEESAEDIPLPVYFPGVDFVEEGHHHKSVEDHREVDGGWSSEI